MKSLCFFVLAFALLGCATTKSRQPAGATGTLTVKECAYLGEKNELLEEAELRAWRIYDHNFFKGPQDFYVFVFRTSGSLMTFSCSSAGCDFAAKGVQMDAGKMAVENGKLKINPQFWWGGRVSRAEFACEI